MTTRPMELMLCSFGHEQNTDVIGRFEGFHRSNRPIFNIGGVS
jgi:hypothetical protein